MGAMGSFVLLSGLQPYSYVRVDTSIHVEDIELVDAMDLKQT